MMKIILRSVVFGALLFVAIMGIIYLAINSNNSAVGGAFRIEWQSSDRDSADKNEAGIFEIKGVLISSQTASFFYAIQTKMSDAPTTNVLSTAPESNTSSVLSNFKTQTLGKINDSYIGVIEVKIEDIPGQIISLQASFPGDSFATWTVKPLKQINPLKLDTKPITYIPFVPQFTPLTVEASSVGGENVAVLRIFTAGTSGEEQYLRYDSQQGLIKITQSDFYKLGGSALSQQTQDNVTSSDTSRATPAPFLPTPTLRT